MTFEEMEAMYKEATFDYLEGTENCTEYNESLEAAEEHLVNLNFNYYDLK